MATIGLPASLLVALQRAGRVLRRGGLGLFVVFFEPWASDISLAEFTTGNLQDPDRPRSSLTSTSRKPERASYASVAFVQGRSCLRKQFADYLDDQSPDGEPLLTLRFD